MFNLALNPPFCQTAVIGSAYFDFPKSLCAQSDAQISPAVIIITSFNTNLPAPDKYGNPNSGVGKSPPRLGTYTSGVVIKNVSVTSDIPKVKSPPIIPILADHIPRRVRIPIITITVPRPYAKM